MHRTRQSMTSAAFVSCLAIHFRFLGSWVRIPSFWAERTSATVESRKSDVRDSRLEVTPAARPRLRITDGNPWSLKLSRRSATRKFTHLYLASRPCCVGTPATWNAVGMRDDARNVMQPLSTVSLTPAQAYLASTSQNAPTSHLHRCGGCRVSLAEYILPVPVEASSSQILSQLPIDENHVQSNHEAWVFVQYTSRIPASSMSHADELALPSTQLL